MTIPLWCLTGFAAWTLLLVFSVISWRSVMVLRGQKLPNEFTPGVPHGPELYWRINRAHLNAAENLPVLAAVVLVAHLTGVRSGVFDTLAADPLLRAGGPTTYYGITGDTRLDLRRPD